MAIDSRQLHSKLKEFFGFDSFKGDQEKIISYLVSGHDAFVLMPTGGGKSLCYQLPALVMEGTAIVISPLIALMKNQVDAIRGFVAGNDGIAHFLNSSLSKAQIAEVKDDLLSGVTKLLYVAPESLTKPENVEMLKEIKISFYAVDEAHCISEWGHDFRPEYRRIKDIMDSIGSAPVIALTATATPKVQSDILKNLGIQDAKVFKSSFNRPNLYYEVRDKSDPKRDIIKFIKQNPGKSGIIYCLSRKKVEELATLLSINGIKALPYHAVIARTFCRTLVYRGSLYGQYVVVKHLYERSFLRFYHAVEASILSHGIPCTDVASVPVGHDACVIHLSVVYITTLHGTFS